MVDIWIVVLIAWGAFIAGFVTAALCSAASSPAPSPKGFDSRRIDLLEDANGKRYTARTFATRDDPWYGATILTSGVIKDLERRGMLPLKEVIHA